jgi:rhodanese-related sulfurtransferase
MPITLKEMMEAANEAVPRIEPARARVMIEAGGVLLLDVRDAVEVKQSGKLKGAVNISRGLLEFKADPESPARDKAFAEERPVLVYCASGGRSALAGRTLKELGYRTVYNLGGFKAAADGGLETEPG